MLGKVFDILPNIYNETYMRIGYQPFFLKTTEECLEEEDLRRKENKKAEIAFNYDDLNKLYETRTIDLSSDYFASYSDSELNAHVSPKSNIYVPSVFLEKKIHDLQTELVLKQKLLDDTCFSHQKEKKTLLDQHDVLKRQDISNGKKVMETPIAIFQGETSGFGNSNYMLKKSKTSTDLISSNISISGISSKDCKHNIRRKSNKTFVNQFQKVSFVKKCSLEKPVDVVVANSSCISDSLNVSCNESCVVSDKSSCHNFVDVELKKSSFYLKQVPQHLRQSKWMSKQEVGVSKNIKNRPIPNKKKETKRQAPLIVKKREQLPDNKKIALNSKKIPKSKQKLSKNQVWRKVLIKANQEGPKQVWVPKVSATVLQTESSGTPVKIQKADELEIFLQNTAFILNNWDELSKGKDSEEMDLTSSESVQFVKN